MPESRVVKVNADLLAFEPLPIYIGVTKQFKLGLREESGVWQKIAGGEVSARVPLLYSVGQAYFCSRRQATRTIAKRMVWLPKI